jgi:4-amino-4-deoxy-L-arabinose transferase-like glycosyltransferase
MSVLQRPFRRFQTSLAVVEPALRAGLWGIAFWIGYHLQVRLEHQLVGWRELTYLILAGLFVFAAAWPRGAGPTTADTRWPRALARYDRWLAIAVPLLVVGAAAIIGVFFRTHDLNSRPSGIWYDEAQNGLLARRILDGDFPPLFIGGDTQLPSAFFYVYAFAAKVMGEGVLSLRVMSTIGGLAALPLLFLLARQLFGIRTAVLAVFLLAAMRWHVNFSRFGVTNIFAATFVLGAMFFFVLGLRGGKYWKLSLVASGIFVGLTPYAGFYGAFVPFVVVLYWLHSGVFERAMSIRRHAAALAIVVLAALAVYSPVAVWGFNHQDAYLSRTNTASISKNKNAEQTYHAVLKSTRQHLLMFNSSGDTNGRHNLPKAPMLDRFTGILFLLGLALAALRLHKSSHFILLVWIAVFLQNGIWSVSFEAPQAFRSSVVTPAVAMLAALPLAALWNAAARAPGGGSTSGRVVGAYTRVQTWAVRGGVTAVIGLLLGLIAYSNYDTYFNIQLEDARVWTAYNSDITFVAKQMNAAEKTDRLLISSLFSSPVIRYVNPNVGDLHQYQIDPARDVPISGDKQTLILLDRTKPADVAWIEALYPGATTTSLRPPGKSEEPAVFAITVPADEITSLQGLRATYQRPDAAPVTRRETKIDFDWLSQPPPLAFPFRAQWSGVMRFADYQPHTISVVAPGAITLRIDGAEVASGNGRVDFASEPYRGLRTISIDANVDSLGQVSLLDQGQPFAAANLFSGEILESRHGLVATFYHNQTFADPVAFRQFDPFLAFRNHEELPFGLNFSAIWRGHLDAPESGVYTFALNAVDNATLTIDGQAVVDAKVGEKQVTLTAGKHDIEVRMVNSAGYAELYLRWLLPSGKREIIPSANYSP